MNNLLSLSQFSLWQRWGFFILWAIATGGGMLLLLSFSFPPIEIPDQNPLEKKELSFPRILGGTLFLKEKELPVGQVSFEKKLEIGFEENRPDLPYRQQLILRWKGSGEKKLLQPGERVFFQFNEKEKSGFAFSDAPTPFWLHPILLSRKEAKVELGIDSFEGTQKTFSALVALRETQPLPKEKLSEESPLKILSQALWRGPEISLERIEGGKEPFYRGQKIEMACQTLVVNAGDLLLWKENQWEKAKDPKKAESPILAQVKEIRDREIEIRSWEKGGESFSFSLPANFISSKEIKVEEFLSQIHLHTLHQVFCKVEKEAWILKEGEWLSKQKGRWRRGVKGGEKEGELFYFDAIVKKGKKPFLKGYWIDPLHTKATTIEVPIAQNQSYKKEENSLKIFEKQVSLQKMNARKEIFRGSNLWSILERVRGQKK